MKLTDYYNSGLNGISPGLNRPADGSAGTGRAGAAGKTGGSSPDVHAGEPVDEIILGEAAKAVSSIPDAVELSGLLAKVNGAVAQSDPVREARIERLRATFQAGQYRVDSAAVSRALIGDALAQTAGGSGK